MSIRKKDLLDLELMSYTDIAYEIIKEDKKQYNTPTLFKEVCKLLELSDEELEEKIGDFFTALSTDKRFILIDSVNWDLKENHVVKVVVDEGEDDITDEIDEEDEDIENEEDEYEDDIDNDDDNDIDEDLEDDYSDEAIDDVDSDDIDDLTIMSEDEIDE